MKFFVPDWDDRVDPGYDFLTERFTLDRDAYEDDVYGHEVTNERLYDGILISRMALGEAGPKRERVERLGMRRFLRLPNDLQLLGDCGAYGYIREKEPRFESADVIDYYHRLGFDYGVSVDHLIVTEFNDERKHRYGLTLRNAEEFLTLYQRGDYRFTPVGAIQGWDVPSYVEAARALVKMGYDYIAVGALARSATSTIAGILLAIRASVPTEARLHLFGISRLSLLPLLHELNIESVDSAAPLRQAWLSAKDNYYTLRRTYAAIRIPIAHQERPKNGTLVGRSTASLAQLSEAEREALSAVRAFDRQEQTLRAALNAVMTYDRLLANRLDRQTSQRRRELYHETLRDRPWRKCPCKMCRDLGVEIVIFRGNNRNRRRGFHNLWVLQRRIHSSGNGAESEFGESRRVSVL